jgi:hypothetical protein
MAIPKLYNFNYYAGDLYQLVLYPRNKDGSAFDLQNYDVGFSIATQRGNPNAIVFSSSPQVNLSPPRILITIPPEEGAQLKNRSYLYDLEIRKNDQEDVVTLLTGEITVQQEVTIYGEQDYESLDAGGVVIDDLDVIIDGGIPTSVYYSLFDGGTP